jgi:hypothetical protein
MPNPTVSDVHVNAPLTNISIAYIQDSRNFVADKIFPVVPVSKQSDRYYTYDRGEFNRDEAQKRAPGTESAGGSYTIDNTPTYYCDVFAFHKDVPDQVRANADAVLNPDMEATMYVTQKLLLKREKTFMTNYFTTGLWTTDVTGVSSSPSGSQAVQWSDYTSSDPIVDIRTRMTNILQSTGFLPNTLLLGQQVFDKLVDHPDIIDRIKYGQTAGGPAIVNAQTIAAILGLDRILVSAAIENTAKEGQTASHSFVAGKNALLAYSAPSPGLMTPSAGYTFSWNGFLGASAMGNRIKKFRLDLIESDRVEGEMAFDMKLVAADLGCFFSGIVA